MEENPHLNQHSPPPNGKESPLNVESPQSTPTPDCALAQEAPPEGHNEVQSYPSSVSALASTCFEFYDTTEIPTTLHYSRHDYCGTMHLLCIFIIQYICTYQVNIARFSLRFKD